MSLWQDAEEVEQLTDGRWEFAPTPGGGTRVTMTPLAHISGRMRIFRRFHRRLKRALEQGA